VDRGALGQLERDLDEQLGLRTRDQHASVDGQLDPPEAARAEDVGDRLARDAAPDPLADDARRGGRHR
jgi:hypothetical protein